MIKFCPNIHFMYLEYPFLERFAAAASDGFGAVEMTFPYDTPIGDIISAAGAAGIEIVEFNTPPGELVPKKSRGIGALPGREQEYLDQIKLGIKYALALRTPRLLTLAGFVHEEAERGAMMTTFLGNLERASQLCADQNITLLIEAHNRTEHPNYLLQTLAQVREIIERVKAPNLRVLFDFFHTGINEGDVIECFKTHTDLIDHIQIGDVPGRHEPGTGELDYTEIFKTIDQSTYDGWVGGEYFPSAKNTSDCLGWMKIYGLRD